MRTVVPPQFSGEDLQRLLAAALTAPPAARPRPARQQPSATASQAAPHVPPATAPTEPVDPWDEPW